MTEAFAAHRGVNVGPDASSYRSWCEFGLPARSASGLGPFSDSRCPCCVREAAPWLAIVPCAAYSGKITQSTLKHGKYGEERQTRNAFRGVRTGTTLKVGTLADITGQCQCRSAGCQPASCGEGFGEGSGASEIYRR